jgi:hypothetical protein
MLQLKQVQQDAGVMEINIPSNIIHNPEDVWDDIVNEPIAGALPGQLPASSLTSAPSHSNTNATLLNGPLPIENYIIALPSNGNITNDLRDLELVHRISQADHQLNQIRNLIAEKSFQFSHVLRVAPRKAVATRSRTVVKKLNNEIAGHCRLYSKC